MAELGGSMERAMLVLKTWCEVGERWSRMAVMKVMVSGVGERARDAIFRRWDRNLCVYEVDGGLVPQ